jgi:hypothetical protein
MPVKNDNVQAEKTVAPVNGVVSTREVNTVDGLATEIEYTDGSIQVIPKNTNNPLEL